MVKAAVRRANLCITEHGKKQKKLKATSASAGKVGATAAARAACLGKDRVPLWDHGVSIAQTITSTQLKDYSVNSSGTDMSMPLIIRCQHDPECGILAKEGDVYAEVKNFGEKFQKSVIYVDKARGQKPASPTVGGKALAFIQTLAPKLQPDGIMSERLKEFLDSASIFGIAKNSEHVTTEMHYLPGFRVGFGGSRTVVAMPIMDILAVLKEAGINDTLNMSKAFDFTRRMSIENLNRLEKRGHLYAGTVTFGDVFFIPAGWMLAERVVANTDFLGIRCGVAGAAIAGQTSELASLAESLKAIGVEANLLAEVLELGKAAKQASPADASKDNVDPGEKDDGDADTNKQVKPDGDADTNKQVKKEDSADKDKNVGSGGGSAAEPALANGKQGGEADEASAKGTS